MGPGLATYVERGRARGFLAPPSCGEFWGLLELEGLLRRNTGGIRPRSLVVFEQVLADGLVDPAESSRGAERYVARVLNACTRKAANGASGGRGYSAEYRAGYRAGRAFFGL